VFELMEIAVNVLVKWRKRCPIVFWDLSENKFHVFIFSQTLSHTLVLKKLEIAFKVFSIS
jgi:hypothetical protein